MKSSNDFVRNGTLSEKVAIYQVLKDKYSNLLVEKLYYDILLEIGRVSQSDNKLSFKEEFKLYNILEDYMNLDHYSDKDELLDLIDKFKRVYGDVGKYVTVKEKLKFLERKKYEMLNSITFKKFMHDEECENGHIIVRLGDELKCLRCGATTNDYDLSKEEIDFLELAADKQEMFLSGVTENDLPLLQVLMEENGYYRNLISLDGDDSIFTLEDLWIFNKAEIYDLSKKIEEAHMLDSRRYEYGDMIASNPKYFSPQKAVNLLFDNDLDLDIIKNSESRFKDLMIELCKIVKYEILILSGEYIPNVFNQIQSEENRIAFVKAYNNISNKKFRESSEYFGSVEDARKYDCRTADNEINKKILQIKDRR